MTDEQFNALIGEIRIMNTHLTMIGNDINELVDLMHKVNEPPADPTMSNEDEKAFNIERF